MHPGSGRGQLTAENGDESDAVRTVFAWSYRALPEAEARFFRLLGLHPGPEFSNPAAAAVAGCTSAEARRLLDTLATAHLLEPVTPGRYQFHDLMRAYAIDAVGTEESEETRLAASRRLIGWYLMSAAQAQEKIAPLDRRIPSFDAAGAADPARFSDHSEALQWFQAELANLVAAVRVATRTGLDELAWRLAVVLRGYCMRHNTFEAWFASASMGLEAARRTGDRHAEAEVLDSLARAYVQSHRLAEGAGHHGMALEIRREIGDRIGEAISLNALGLVHLRTYQPTEAYSAFERGLSVLRETDAPYWESAVLETSRRRAVNWAGWTKRLASRKPLSQAFTG